MGARFRIAYWDIRYLLTCTTGSLSDRPTNRCWNAARNVWPNQCGMTMSIRRSPWRIQGFIILARLEALRRNVSGAVLVEMAILAPFLVLLFVTVAQWGLIFYTLSSMESASRTAVRQLAVGNADDETNGNLTDCASISGVGPDGNKSAEQIACNQIAGLFGKFSVTATDGTANNFGTKGADARVTLNVEHSSIVIFDPFGLMGQSVLFSAGVTMRMQDPRS